VCTTTTGAEDQDDPSHAIKALASGSAIDFRSLDTLTSSFGRTYSFTKSALTEQNSKEFHDILPFL